LREYAKKPNGYNQDIDVWEDIGEGAKDQQLAENKNQ